MSFFAEGGSITRPPLLNDSNYPYWKVRMRAFIKSQEERAWRSILTGWTPPSESDDITKVKSEIYWTDAEDKLSSYNNKALHAIFNGVGEGYIKLISSCVSAKEAWEILQTQFEGTTDVKRSRLVMLTTRFENLRMTETESLTEFYERLSDIANEYFALGEKLENNVLVRKIVRVLPDRFQTKLTAIEEAKDLDTMKVEELMGSLQTFELNQQIRQKEKPSAPKEKSVALKSSKIKDSEEDDGDDELALLTKNFQKYMKKIGNKRSSFKSSKGNQFSRPFENNNKKGVQCRECEGFGHIQSECANTLKKNKKVMTASWSDKDSESSDEDDNVNLALTSVVSSLTLNLQENERIVCLNNTVQEDNSDCESNESDLDEDSLKESYKDMYDQWLRVCSENRLMASNNKLLQDKNDDLVNTVRDLEGQIIAKDCEIKRLANEINHMIKGVKMLNPNSKILDDVIDAGQKAGNYSGLGSDGFKSTGKTNFVNSGIHSVASSNLSAGTSHVDDSTKGKSVFKSVKQINRFIPICHFCGVKGHIRPRCFTMMNLFKSKYLNHYSKTNHVVQKPSKFVWVEKTRKTCLATFTCHKSRASNSWYFDSGCSRHMTGDASILSNFKTMKCGGVTFGDGMSGNILGKGTLNLDGLPKLKNVLLVEGLKANLISISQICDQGFTVNFSRDNCDVIDQNGVSILKGYRSIDNCYTVSPSLTCHTAIRNTTDLCLKKWVI